MRAFEMGILGFVLLVASCTGSAGRGTEDAAATAPPDATVPTTTGTPSTTVAPVTTVPATTTQAPATASSTIPGEPPTSLQLSDRGVQAGDTWISFGYDADEAVSIISAVLGAPASDSGWVAAHSSPFGVCPEPTVRGVSWGSFTALFTRAETVFRPEGVPHFFAYYDTDLTDPAGVKTMGTGIGAGDTLATLEKAYAGEIEITESPFGDAGSVWSYRETDWTGMWGFTEGVGSEERIVAINGGQGCGE